MAEKVIGNKENKKIESQKAEQRKLETKKIDHKKIEKRKKNIRFFKDLKNELKRVTWLSWPKLVKNTLTVIAACLIIGMIIWIFDAAIGKLISWSLLR